MTMNPLARAIALELPTDVVSADVKALSSARESPHTDPGHHFVTAYESHLQTSYVIVALFQGKLLSRTATQLVQRTYGRLGYISTRSIESSRASISLEATVDNALVGTLSVTLDSTDGIQADELYAEEIAPFRRYGTVCEFTRLAVDAAMGRHDALCSLFYVAYVYAHLLRGASDLFIEVNPRHARFYERMLGFRRISEVKTCPRVMAPAILLHLDFLHTREQIIRSRKAHAGGLRRLYQYAAPAAQELELLERIKRNLLV